MNPTYKRVLRVALPLGLCALLALLAWQRIAGMTGRDGYAGKTVLINEICVKNLTGLQDCDGNTLPWIELNNVSGEDISLTGYTLSDDEDWPDKWRFTTDVTLSGGANHLVVVYADGTDTVDKATIPHIGFVPGDKNETLSLYAPDGTLVDSLHYPEQQYDVSYGRRLNDGDSDGFFGVATPGQDNPVDFLPQQAEAADLGAVEFSVAGGFYDDAQSLALQSADPDAVILYTTDGSIPTRDSKLYTGPLALQSRAGEKNEYASQVAAVTGDWLMNYALRYAPQPLDKATTVTARLCKNGVLGQAVTAQTYWIGVRQPTLLTVSVTADAADLFGRNGICAAGSSYFTLHKYGTVSSTGNYNADRNIDGSIEILAPDGTELLQDSVELSLSGGWSRQSAILKNLHVGLTGGRADVLPQADRGELKAFVLRGTGNGAAYSGLHQDAFLNNYLYSTDTGAQYNQPAVLYLQDEYWGIYTIREGKNADFFKRHFGIKSGNLICPGTSTRNETQAEKYAFGSGVDALDCTTQQSMDWVEQNVDVDEFIRYIIAQMYAYNADGLYNGGNNSILWKAYNPVEGNEYADGRWRFLFNDFDNTMIDVAVDPFAYLLENDFSLANNEASPWYAVPENLFQKLWCNAAFRTRFAAEYRTEMQTLYAPQSLLPAWQSWTDTLRPEIDEDLARRTVTRTALAPLAEELLDTTVTEQLPTAEQWEASVVTVQQFFTDRSGYMLDYLDRYLAAAESGVSSVG